MGVLAQIVVCSCYSKVLDFRDVVCLHTIAKSSVPFENKSEKRVFQTLLTLI